jgi:hypothetical protein
VFRSDRINRRRVVEVAKCTCANGQDAAHFAVDDLGRTFRFAFLEHFGCFGLFDPRDLVTGSYQLVGHGPVGTFGKARMGHVTFHVLEMKHLHADVGVHVEHFVELA